VPDTPLKNINSLILFFLFYESTSPNATEY